MAFELEIERCLKEEGEQRPCLTPKKTWKEHVLKREQAEQRQKGGGAVFERASGQIWD